MKWHYLLLSALLDMFVWTIAVLAVCILFSYLLLLVFGPDYPSFILLEGSAA